jgi:hypothetical protein
MRRAWGWYRRTLSVNWARMAPRRRLTFIVLLVAGFAIPIVFIVTPSARVPLLIGYLVVFVADIPIALRRARRKRP